MWKWHAICIIYSTGNGASTTKGVNIMTINYITSEVEFKKSTHIEGNLVHVKCTTKHPSGVIGCDWTLDFDECTDDEIMALATRSVVIDLQIGLRKCDRADLEAMQGKEVDVHEYVNRTRTRTVKKVTVDTLAADAAKLTPEQLVAAIEALQAQVDADQ